MAEIRTETMTDILVSRRKFWPQIEVDAKFSASIVADTFCLETKTEIETGILVCSRKFNISSPNHPRSPQMCVTTVDIAVDSG